MTRFSICINAYNAQASILRAIKSVTSQGYDDYELIILDDASTDNTLSIIKECALKNNKIKVIEKKNNAGLYLGRKTIIEQCCGEYTLFLDADDEMNENFLEKLDKLLIVNEVDMYHYGIEVRGHDVSEDECLNFQNYINAEVECLNNSKIIDSIFGGCGEYKQDWQLPNRAFKTELLKRANKLMVEERLDYAEDSYEMFVICTLAKTQVTNNCIKGLIYNYGMGLNGQSSWNKEKFVKVAKGFFECAQKIQEFANFVNTDLFLKNATTAKNKLLDLLFNDWHSRVSDEDKIEVAKQCSEIFDPTDIASQLARKARDDAYAMLADGKTENYTEAEKWLSLAQQLMSGKASTSAWLDYSIPAKSHIEDLKKRSSLKNINEQNNAKIFVCCHRDAEVFNSKILIPLQAGASQANWRFPWALQDDLGENISELNPMYCELTAQYWAWKNVRNDYFGFCHYRRYFNFSNQEFEENEFGEVIDNRINDNTQRKYGLADDNILKQLEGFDLVTTKFQDLRDFPGKFETPLQHWEEAPNLFIEDLNTMIEIVKRKHPSYTEACDTYLNGNVTCFCNMFIMKSELFNDYCNWLFPLLEEFCNKCDMKHYSKEALRTPGHLAERLLNIYIIKHMLDNTGLKHKQVQCVHFERPEKTIFPRNNFKLSEINKPTVPIVLASGDNYVPVMTCAIYSLIKNANPNCRYDVVILHKNVTGENQRIMSEFFASFPNMSLRFFNVEALVEDYALVATGGHIGTETYYRFLIQEVLPEYDKVIYLDCDLIVQGDISKLYEFDLQNNLIGAVHDIDFHGNLNFKDNKRIEYNKDVLKMKDPYNYFQAGVLVLNTRALRLKHSITEWLDLTCNDDLLFDDQDILNMECEGSVFYLPQKWNVVHNCKGRIEKVLAFAPAKELETYFASRNEAQIIHYAGYDKPWIYLNVDLEEIFWEYAKETPFYQKLLDIRSNEGAKAYRYVDEKLLDKRFERHQKIYHPILGVTSNTIRKVKNSKKQAD